MKQYFETVDVKDEKLFLKVIHNIYVQQFS